MAFTPFTGKEQAMRDPDSSDPLRPPPSRPIFQGLFSAVLASLLYAASPGSSGPALAQESAKKPNILVIMGDDVGWFNIGAYHRGIMSGKTPNLDKLAAEGMMFTDYYAEASCTAGRGQLHHRRNSPADGPDDCRPSRCGCGVTG